MSRNKVPIVAIVGRANVGKSSLFNAILRRREAIVADEPGTTRDSVLAKATYEDQDFWLVDTAGMKDATDEFEFTIQEQIVQAADSADIILVVVEADVAVTEEDRRVAKLALKSRKPVVLVVNKLDKNRQVDLDDYLRLGIKPVLGTSTTQHSGINELLDYLAGELPAASILEASDRIRVALLGRPNVGKSAMFNALIKKQQAIVADRAGTTRDINRYVIRYQGKEIELLDTAGIRRSGRIEAGVEKFSVIRSLAAIEEADICLLLLDANELRVALDQKIAGLVKEAVKGLVLVISKWDSIEKDAFTRDELAPRIARDFDFVPWAPLVLTSSVTGQNITKLFDLMVDIDDNRKKTYQTSSLNRWLRKVTDKHLPAGLKNRQPKLNYMVHEEGNPDPSFKIFGSQTKFVHWSYKRYMEREFREAYGLSGTGMKFWFIEKHDSHKANDRDRKPRKTRVTYGK